MLSAKFANCAKRTRTLSTALTELEQSQAELIAHIKRLLARRRYDPALVEGQGVLFAELEATVGESPNSTDANESNVEIDLEDSLVPDGESTEEPKQPKAKKRRDRRKTDQSNLRREVQRVELPEEERRCPVTGAELVETGVKITSYLDYQRAELFVVEQHQVVYGPALEVAEERQIEPLIAPEPPPVVEGVRAGAGLLAWILCQKYVLHLPLYRQEDAFARLDVRLSRKTLCDWVLKSAFALRPVAAAIERQIRAGPVLQIDDTPIKVKRPGPGGGKNKIRQSYLWVETNPLVSGVVFRFTEGRSGDDVASLFPPEVDFGAIDVLVGDGYAGNRSGVREAGLNVRHAGCWAHVLRKFRDAKAEAPAAMALFMKDIDELYDIEERAGVEGLGPDEVLALRREESLPIVVNLMRLTSRWKETYSLSGKVADAMKYVRGQRHALLEFLRDGRVPIDNNVCERAIRPVAVGRRNWLFAGSVEGAAAAATIYTLVESARASGVDPLAYLKTVLVRLGTCIAEQVDELVPWAMRGELPAYRDRMDES